MKTNKKKRVQFDFTQESIVRLDRLRTKTEATNRAEVIRRALKLYDYVVDMACDGYILEMVKEDEKRLVAEIIV